MILIFDTYGGLCNQFYDIQCAINFCSINNIQFSFRHASLRNKDLKTWFDIKIDELFDLSFLKKNVLYIENIVNLNLKNTYNYDGKMLSNQILKRENILCDLKKIDKSFIVLKQFWVIFQFQEIVDDVYKSIKPSEKIMKKYQEIRDYLDLRKNNYNFIHYRYEHDFIDYFGMQKKKSLLDILMENPFSNKQLKIYIATTNLEGLLKHNLEKLNHLILYKNEKSLENFNFEEKAFIDYMIGLNSLEVCGHSKSSFSNILNYLKGTNFYYE